VAPSRARMHEILAQLFRALHRFALGLARPIIIIIRQQSAEILENWDHIQRHTLSHEHVLTGLACLIQSEALSFTVRPTPAHCCAGMGGVRGPRPSRAKKILFSVPHCAHKFTDQNGRNREIFVFFCYPVFINNIHVTILFSCRGHSLYYNACPPKI
jgi:hypothetical protein